MIDLEPAHFRVLRASALNDESMEIMGCRSVPRDEFASLSPALAECESILCFAYPGIDGFCRHRLFPVQGDMKYWQPPGSGTHLYILPSVRSVLSNPNIEIAITEGEKKAACLTQHGIPTIGLGGVSSWGNGAGDLHVEFDPVSFIDRNVLIVFDSNAWRQEKVDIGHALYALGKALESRGGKVEALVIPPTDDGKDQGADDFIAKHGIGKFKELKRIKLRHDGLAQFKPWWENWRKGKAQDSKELSKVASRLQPVEPWPDPVDGVALANEIRAALKRFVITVQPEAVVVEALWILFTHTLDAFGIAPILAFWSPVPECGKSINQSIVARLCPKSLEGSSMTEAVVFRVVDLLQPTIFVDEAADLLEKRPELMALFRAAHQRNKAYVYRTQGDNHEVTAFSTWSAKSLAITTAKIENALASRCLIVKMQRKTSSERTERYSATKEYPDLDILCRKASRWARDNIAAVRDAVPDIPDIENRSLDNYEPLFKIAHVVGGGWPQLINEAAVKMLGADNPVDLAISIELLKDIKTIFDAEPKGDDRKLASADLVKALVAKEDRPWSEYNRGKPISQNQVARLLKDFFIFSRKIRPEKSDKTCQGYFERQFEEAIERYSPAVPPFTESQPEHQNSDNENKDLGQKTQPEQNDSVPVAESGLSVENYGQRSTVPVGNPNIGSRNTFSANLPATLGRFAQVWALDFEFDCPEGANPEPHCFVAFEIRTGATVKMLREDFPVEPPYGVGPDSLVLLYSGASDLRCHLAVGWPLPENYIDLCVESKLLHNSPGPDRGCPSLIESLDRFGISHIDAAAKKKEQKRYAKPALTDEDRREILPYCASDVVVLPELFTKLLSGMDIDCALERGAYVREMAVIEHRGIPISTREYEKTSANRKQIRLDLIAHSPVGPDLYTEKGSFSYKRFAAWLEKNEIHGWDTTPSGRLVTQEEYVQKVVAVAPGVQPFLDLMLALKDFKKCPFGIDSDGRSHADQIPFGTVSGRNAPSGFVLVCSKFWRWIVRAPEGAALIYCDYSNEEFATAAFLSGDESMIAGYDLLDVYQSVADQLGVSRKNAKVAMLATQYGAGPKRLENSLGVPYAEAEKVFRYHKETYSRYWRWSDECLDRFKSTGISEIVGDGWALRFAGADSDNNNEILTARNFPIQATAAAILRRVVIEAAKEGIAIVGPLHDAVLIQAPSREAKKFAERMCGIMRDVSRQFLNNEIRVSSQIYRDRFEDKDGKEDWKRVSKLLRKY